MAKQGTAKQAAKQASLTVMATLFLAGATAIALATEGTGELGLRAGIRATAKLSAVWFVLAFVASPANALFKNSTTKWLLRHRRKLGLGFAILHFGHLTLVVLLAIGYTDSFLATTAMTSIVGGGIGYLWLLAMTITSFPGPTKAMGRQAWKALHKSGMYLLWGIFVASYAPMAGRGPLYVALLVALVGAYLLRLVAFYQRRQRRRAV